jgi:YD repeat-containing protein
VVAIAHDFGGGSGGGDGPNGGGDDGCGGGGCGGCGAGGDPINLYDGTYNYFHTDFIIGGHFLMKIGRYYSSSSSYDSPFGYGWSLTFNHRLFKYADGSVVLRKDCGIRRKFIKSGSAYITPVGERGTLTENPDGTFSFEEATGLTLNFDLKGRLASVEDPNGNKLVFTYDPRGKLPLIGKSPFSIDPTTATVVAYDYRLTKIEEFNASGATTGRAINLNYTDSTGRLFRIIDHTFRIWTYGFDSAGNLTSVVDDVGNILTYTYTDPNDIHNLTEVSGGSADLTIAYDPSDRGIKQTIGEIEIDVAYTVPLVRTTVVTSVKDGATVVKQDTRVYEFNDIGNPMKIIDNDDNEIRYTRNSAGQITAQEFWLNDGSSLVQQTSTTYSYDTAGHVETMVDTDLTTGKVVTTDFTYDGDRLASMYSYSNAAPAKVFKQEWVYSHDGLGKPVNVIAYRYLQNPGGTVEQFAETSITYDGNGQPTLINYPTGDSDAMTYTNGYATTADGVTYGRDQRGNITAIIRGGDSITYTYDTLDRLTSITQDSKTTSFTYSGLEVQTVTNPDYSISYDFDTLGRITTATRSDTGGDTVIAQITYDKVAGIATLTDSDGAVHTYPFDPLRIWQVIEDPNTQSPLPTVIPVTAIEIPSVPDPLRVFFQRILGK